MDEINQWHRAMTTIVLFGTWDTPISSTTLADAFRIINADDFMQRMLYATRQCSWTSDLHAIKADVIFTLEGVPQCRPLGLEAVPRSPHDHPHSWYDAFLKEMWAIWNETPSVIVVRLKLPVSMNTYHRTIPRMPEYGALPATATPSTPPSSGEAQGTHYSRINPTPLDFGPS